MIELPEWLRQVSDDGWLWYVKVLSGNDTLLNESHQAGPYLPKQLILYLFPSIADAGAENPRAQFQAAVDSHGEAATPTAIWYNNKLRGGTRNECRITNWGGASSPLLDPESTGSLCLFAFRAVPGRDAGLCRIWLCRNVDEEELITDRTGPVEPGGGLVHSPGPAGGNVSSTSAAPRESNCRLARDELPVAWLASFPHASEVVALAIARRGLHRLDPDGRLVRRRQCEFDLFRSIEEAVVLPRVREGFATVDQFVEFANSVTNRRKSRSGTSLELHAKAIFEEEGLPYAYDQVSEENKRPDFIFPSARAYRDPDFPAERLQMLAVKTTCKDRWRQILNEADRIPAKCLLTLQEGVSPNQFGEMKAAGVRLVVPEPLHKAYHSDIRSELLTLSTFIDQTRGRCHS